MSVSDLSQRLASLSPEQRKLFELRMKRHQEEAEAARPRPLPRAEGESAFPLSFAQQRLWLLERMGMGGAAYNVFQAVRLDGPLDSVALGRCLSEIARRQESLRTRFEERPDGAVQVVEPPRQVVPPVVDLRDLPEEEREAEALRRAALEVQ
ncbi:MAG TPA: condensation domain-containing protein, partial [Thermoanaerobaculia bacterium]|nr:condensation domain-containing protein [Thermoanaerobaculia bacterium]